LNNGGYIFLAIPDYRYCFDRYRKESNIFEVLEKYYNKTIKPQPVERLESMYYTTHNDPGEHWSDFKRGCQNIYQQIVQNENYMNNNKNKIIENIETIKHIIESNNKSEYVDSHCWKLTPSFFKYLIGILHEIKVLDLTVEKVYKTLYGSCEFYAILKKVTL
jgi:hypothetical protein